MVAFGMCTIGSGERKPGGSWCACMHACMMAGLLGGGGKRSRAPRAQAYVRDSLDPEGFV